MPPQTRWFTLIVRYPSSDGVLGKRGKDFKNLIQSPFHRWLVVVCWLGWSGLPFGIAWFATPIACTTLYLHPCFNSSMVSFSPKIQHVFPVFSQEVCGLCDFSDICNRPVIAASAGGYCWRSCRGPGTSQGQVQTWDLSCYHADVVMTSCPFPWFLKFKTCESHRHHGFFRWYV